MANVLIVAYLLIVLALIAVILLQRSEGGGLGMGGGGGGLLTVRGSANVLTRTTAILAALFFATAIGLTVLTDVESGTRSILENAAGADGEAPATVLDALNQLQGDTGAELPLPSDGPQAPAAPETDSTLAVPAAPETDPGLAVPEAPAAETSEQTPAAPAN